MERTLYNGLLSGVSLDGQRFFYPNPLESDGRHQRSPWFGVACCPGNMTRFLARCRVTSMHSRATRFMSISLPLGTAEIKLDNGRTVTLAQETRYPWDGAVKMTVSPDQPGEFTVNVRIPGWARGAAMPSDLYEFQDKDKAKEEISLKVNGEIVPLAWSKGYASTAHSPTGA